MPDYIKIKKKGIYGYDYDDARNKHIGKKIKKNRILTALRSSCTIDEDVVLLDIIKHVEKYKSLKSFVGFYSWCSSIDELNLDAFTPVVEEKENNIKYLKISWDSRNFEWKDKKQFDLGTDFVGIGRDENGEENRYSVSYCPMNEIAYLPVVLDTKFEIYNGYENKPKILSSTKKFSLLDILDAIYWDISFVGGPKEKEQFLDKLEDRMDEVE